MFGEGSERVRMCARVRVCASMCTDGKLIERRQRCVTAATAPSDSLQVKDGHRVWGGGGGAAVSMVSSGTQEGTDWKLDLHKLRLRLSAVVQATFYKQSLCRSAGAFIITCVASDR